MAGSSKECTHCEETLPLAAFHRNKAGKLGLQAACIACKRDIYNKWRPRNAERVNEYQRDRRQALKEEVFKYYGNACSCCGESNSIFLSIDHINNDGAKHREIISGDKRSGAGCRTYAWIKNNGFPNTFQVLCFNCNWAKSHGGCPHQKTSKLAATQS